MIYRLICLANHQVNNSCRQIFVQQPNRHFARSLIVTEKIFRLVHYDRSGLYVTPLFDIHKDAPLFVQFVVGLSSPNEQHLGLDTSVQWTIDEVSGKVSGMIEVHEKDEATGSSTSTVYDLDMNEPPYVRPDIRGRGTVAWHAFDRITREPVLIKDAWHTDSQEVECEYLKDARGIPGIVEMIAFQDHIVETADYRPPGFRNKEFRNRAKLRVVMKKYGRSVWFFKSRLQLLLALRDALIGTSCAPSDIFDVFVNTRFRSPHSIRKGHHSQRCICPEHPSRSTYSARWLSQGTHRLGYGL
jgi:hypothetical protein